VSGRSTTTSVANSPRWRPITISTSSGTSSDFYRSDVAAAVEAGAHARVALLGFGVDATHGHERTHLDSLVGLAQLLGLYLQSDLVFPEWDAEPEGELADFPSLAVQPAGEDGPQEGPIGIE
jgi:hypothetical protein